MSYDGSKTELVRTLLPAPNVHRPLPRVYFEHVNTSESH